MAFIPKDTSWPMQNAENRRKQFHLWASQGATRFDVQYIVQDSLAKAAREHRWSADDVASMLRELTADLDHVFGKVT